MNIKTLPVGYLESNCYVISDEKTLQCAIIDPGDESNTILDYIESNRLTPVAILITHGHFDHIGALEEVQAQTGAPVYIHAAELGGTGRLSGKLDATPNLRTYAEGDTVAAGRLEFHVIETPGHTMGCVTLLIIDGETRALFTGDTLFAGSCGRTDVGGDMDMMEASLRRLAALPGDYEVYPGHAESTTLENERHFNYYIRHANGDFPNQ
ncbi:MAG: MBL fold metallo-hydrolase [Oscillospiraceae bacterium]|jgi:glyoxylase-like metal-dependent hydrolase (beta-lactamase superfamily II)|nr:MBL fold metallo-hydrolase [Oscillospiraceae bacterium]